MSTVGTPYRTQGPKRQGLDNHTHADADASPVVGPTSSSPSEVADQLIRLNIAGPLDSPSAPIERSDPFVVAVPSPSAGPDQARTAPVRSSLAAKDHEQLQSSNADGATPLDPPARSYSGDSRPAPKEPAPARAWFPLQPVTEHVARELRSQQRINEALVQTIENMRQEIDELRAALGNVEDILGLGT